MDSADISGEEIAAVAPPRVHISVLGTLTVTVDGVDATPRGHIQRRLIAVLARAAWHGAHVSIDGLTDAVYDDGDTPPRPRRSLATLIWRLRKRWGADAIRSDPDGYYLSDSCTVDVARFESLVRAARTRDRDGTDGAAATTVTEALALWTVNGAAGAMLDDQDVERLIELRLGAMEYLGELRVRLGDHTAAIAVLEDVTALRPAWEHSQALLITCYAALGNRTGAYRVGSAARRALLDEGVDPGPELTRAMDRITAPGGRANAAPGPIGSGGGMPGPARGPIGDVGGRLSVRQDGSAQPGVTVPADGTTRMPVRDAPPPGRTRDVAAVVDSVATVLRRRGCAVTAVTGEAGIGKTTVVRAALGCLPAGATVRTLHCDPRRTLPLALFGPLTDDPDVDAGGEPDALTPRTGAAGAGATDGLDALIRRRIAGRVANLASAVGLVLVIEDLHWASPATIHALVTVLEATADSAVAVVVTSRQPTLPADLRPWIAGTIDLAGLPLAATARLLGRDTSDARVASVQRASGGNPLYIQQIDSIGAVDGIVPTDLTAAIGAHIRIVPTEILDCLRVAAAFGIRFDITMLTALDGPPRLDPASWHERLTAATRYRLIRDDPDAPGTYEFVHALVRDFLYRSLTAQRRTVIHAAITRALGRLSIGRPYPPDVIAHHAVRGWPNIPTGDVVDSLAAAAEASAAQLDFVQATVHYRTALDHFAMDDAPPPPQRLARLLGAAGGAAAASGDTTAANGFYQSLLTVAHDADLPKWGLYAALGNLRTAYMRQANPAVTEPLIAAFLDACRVADDDAPAVDQELMGDALAAIQVYRPERTAGLVASAVDVDPNIAGPLRMAVWEHQTIPDQLVTARALVGDPTADPVGAWLRLWVSEVGAGLRALDDRPDCPVPISTAGEQTRFDLAQWRIAVATATGRLGRARRQIRAALDGPAHPDPAENARRVASFYGQEVHLAAVSGDFGAVRASPLVRNPAWASRHPIMRYVGAYVRSLAGPSAAIRGMCDDLLTEVHDEVIPESDIVPRLLLLASTCCRIGYLEALGLCLDHLWAHRGEHGVFRFGQYWGPADVVIADCQAGLGNVDAAIATYRGAIGQLKAAHAWFQLPSAQRALARALRWRGATGDAPEAEQLLALANSTPRTPVE